jgi:hypothetical protein
MDARAAFNLFANVAMNDLAKVSPNFCHRSKTELDLEIFAIYRLGDASPVVHEIPLAQVSVGTRWDGPALVVAGPGPLVPYTVPFDHKAIIDSAVVTAAFCVGHMVRLQRAAAAAEETPPPESTK